MKNCRFCNSETLVKHAFINGKQRFKCKNCGKNQLEKDGRKKYDEKIIKMTMILFSEGTNYRAIARVLSKIFGRKIYYQTIIKWIQKEVDKLPENALENKDSHNIAVVEMDELYTYFKRKNEINSEYGLLLTGTACVCLHFGSGQAIDLFPNSFLLQTSSLFFASGAHLYRIKSAPRLQNA